MPLSLRIENVDQLPDGGPVTYTVDKRGLDIGRDAFMDWTLPDAQRFISGTHCHIRYENGGYWVHDVSTNGTMLNGQDRRITEPYKLNSGDRLYIGGYIVVAEITGEEPAGGAAAGGGGAPAADPWTVEGAADPVDRQQFQREAAHPSQASRPVSADLPDENIGWGMDVGAPAQTDPGELDWGVPKGGSSAPADPGAPDWGTPAPADWAPAAPQAAPAAAPPQQQAADTGAAAGGDWRTPPPDPDAPPPSPDTAQPPAGAFDAGAPVATPPPGAFEAAPPAAGPAAGAFETGAPAAEPPAGAFQAQPQQAAPPSAAAPAEPEQPAAAPPPADDPEPLQLTNPVSVPEPASQAAPAPSAAPAAAGGGFIAAFERGAGLPAGAVAAGSDEQFAEQLGQLLNMTAQNLQAMLLARQETKSAIRSSEVTHIGALENNPLKFSPSVEDALKIMFGEKTRSYLDAQQTIEQSFGDLQRHQLYTFNAMQQALTALIEDLDPEHIAGDTSQDGGLAKLVSSRRAKLWDTYVERFRSKSSGHQRGMVGAFMLLFAEMYDRQG